MSDDKTNTDNPPKVIEDGDAPKTSVEKEQDKAAGEYSKKADNGELTMDVKVSSPFNTYFDGEAFSITGENATGVFDVLPTHHNFISLLNPCTLVIRTVKDEEEKIDISGGMMHVKADKVVVFLDI